jgi:hypothetical protein
MGMFNFLAAGNSLKGLVGRRFHHANEDGAMIPNFGLKPEVADRLREVRETRRREDPFMRRSEVLDREIGQHLQKHSGPRVRSTFRPEKQIAQRVVPEPSPAVAPAAPAPTEVAPPAPGNVGAGWVRKLKIARRVAARPAESGRRVKRQPKRPATYRGDAARQRRAPQWMAGT